MPTCDALHIVGYLFDVGPALSTSMGQAPLSFTELSEWQRCTGFELQPWEARILRQLSLEYLNELQLAKKLTCPSPWDDAPYFKLSLVAINMQQAMRELIKL
jgi:hypothetical protein